MKSSPEQSPENISKELMNADSKDAISAVIQKYFPELDEGAFVDVQTILDTYATELTQVEDLDDDENLDIVFETAVTDLKMHLGTELGYSLPDQILNRLHKLEEQRRLQW